MCVIIRVVWAVAGETPLAKDSAALKERMDSVEMLELASMEQLGCLTVPTKLTKILPINCTQQRMK